MVKINTICIWIAELLPLISSLVAFIFGVVHFFKKGKALYLQIITMAMGCYALSNLYHLCQTLVSDKVAEGFTATYLGRMGFYLFLFAANCGQMNGIMDDGTPQMRPSRVLGFFGPLLAALLYVPYALAKIPLPTKLSNLAVWITAAISMYYNLKHALIPDLGYGFSKAVRPYNISAFLLATLDLSTLLAWAYYDAKYGLLFVALAAILTSIALPVTIVTLKKGVSKWTI